MLHARATALAGLLTAAAGMFWLSVHDVPFYTKGEPREAVVVQQMLAERNLVLPLLERGEVQSKPPLFHWLGAAISAVAGGVSETAVRLPSVGAALVTVAATVAAGYRLYGPAAGIMAGVMLVTCQQFLQSATAARVDMVLAAGLTVALLAFLGAYRDARSRLPLAFYLAVAAAVLTKGPVGYVLPALIVVAFLGVRRDLGYLAGERGRAAPLVLLLPLVWYVLAWLQAGDAFLDKLIFKENVYRVLDPEAVDAGHVRPFYYYVPALLAGMAPWSVLMPAALYDLWKRRGRTHDGSLWLVTWLAVTLVLFSAAGSKRAVYLLPAYPAAALLTAAWLVRCVAAQQRRPHWPPAWVVAGVCAAAGVVTIVLVATMLQMLGVPTFAAVAPLLNPKDALNLHAIAAALGSRKVEIVMWALASAACLAVLVRAAREARWQAAFTSTALLVTVTAATIGPILLRDMARRATVKPFMADVRALVPADEPLSFYGGLQYLEYLKPAAVYYTARAIPVVATVPEVRPDGRLWFLVGEKSLGELQADLSGGGATYRFRTAARHTYADSPGREALVLVEAAPRPRRVRRRDHVGYR